MKHFCLRGIFLLGGLLGAFCFSALAQEATILGTVTDPSNAAVPNVAITVTNTDTGVVNHLTTSAAGDYVAADIHIGHYTVHAEATGFKVAEKKGIVLAVGDRLRVDFKLELGSTQQSITVEATPVAVQADSGERRDVKDGTEMTQLALNGRSFYTLATLVPGASNNMADDQMPTSQSGDATVSFNGLREPHNVYLADGAEVYDRGGGGAAIIMPSMDAVAEFQVLTSNYSSDFGLSSAGTTTMVFKSGTSQLHGTAWEFVRNNSFDAGYFLNNAAGIKAPELRFNIFGFNLGGPVVFPGYNKNHNKTFFFYNMEWRRIIEGGSLSPEVPNTSWDTGAFLNGTNCDTAAGSKAPCPVVPTLTPAALTALAAGGSTIPATLQNLASDIKSGVLTPGQPFTPTTYAIPSRYLDPNTQLLLKEGIFSTPNSGTQEVPKYVGGANVPTMVREELVRIDQHFNDKVSVFGHYVYDSVATGSALTMWSGENDPTTSTAFGNPSYSYTIHLMHTISPTLLNEIAFSQDHNAIDFTPTGVVSQPSGFSIPRLFAGINPNGNVLNRNPGIHLSGTTGTDYTTNWCPWTNYATGYEIKDDLSWVKGAHQLRIGGDWMHFLKVQQGFTATEGNYTFSGNFSGNDMADFLLGMAGGYSESSNSFSGHFPSNSFALYAQDNWRVTHKLTLNLGLRWDGVPHTEEVNGMTSNFYPSLWNSANAAVVNSSGIIMTGAGGTPAAAFQASPSSLLSPLGAVFYFNGLGVPGQNGITKHLINARWANFGPRIGFAYDLTGAGKTVIRGGFGMMYEREQGNDMYNLLGNSPWSETVSPSNVAFSNPDLSLVTGVAPVSPIGVASLSGIDGTDYKLPTSMQYSLGVQRQLGRDSVVSIAYVGNQNRHQFDYRNFNLPPNSPTLLGNIINSSKTGVTYDQNVPYLGWGALQLGEQAENSHYNSLQISFRSRVGHDLTLDAAYTYGRSIDPGSGGYAQANGDDVNTDNPYNRAYDNGPSTLDRQQVAFINWVYDLPILRHSDNHLLKSVAGGWEISGIATMETGLPLAINLSGSQGSNGVPNSTNRPDLVGPLTYGKTFSNWISASSFATPALGYWGSLGKGVGRGPGRDNWNISIFKDFLLSEKHNTVFELRFESFNTFNHTEFNGVNSSYPSGNFGSISTTWDPRIFQFGLKLKF